MSSSILHQLVSHKDLCSECKYEFAIHLPGESVPGMLEGLRQRTMVSVTYGVGTHEREGGDVGLSCLEKRLIPSFTALRKAVVLDEACMEGTEVFIVGKCGNH